MNSLSQILGSGAAKPWVSGRVYQPGTVVLSPADRYQQYVRITAAGSGATDPSSDTTNYAPFGGRGFKSIQKGAITIPNGSTSAVVTVSAVNTSRYLLLWAGGLGIATGSIAVIPELDLTNATTITASIHTAASASGVRGRYQLVEFY